MNRINELFSKKKKNILSIYFTAGYPALNDTSGIIEILQNKGVDMIEIGIPFSDPVADGPVIQESSSLALKNGMSLKNLFSQLKNVRQTVSLPLVMMGYINPVFKMGMEKFLTECSATGIDGVIIPDLPLEEYQEKYEHLFKKHNIHFICLITPQSSEERVRFIDSISGGFIYMVSSASTTGRRDHFDDRQLQYFRRIQNMGLKNPFLAGFGISNRETFHTACKFANGAIIGSAFIRAISEKEDMEKKISGFLRQFCINKQQ